MQRSSTSWVLASIALLAACGPNSRNPAPALQDARSRALTAVSPGALQFNGTSQYVTFGAAPTLGASRFTLETWVYRTAAGTTTGTGNGGVTGVPLIAKGRAENDGSNVDANYFLGIDGSNRIVADFEDMATGGNHPVTGVGAVPLNEWHHVAATYDGQTWNLYLDGVLDKTYTLASAFQPRADSIQHASLASALTSTGVAAGFFAGRLDEARIWNCARTQAQIQAGMNREITFPAIGLLGRWGLDEGAGATAVDSSASSVNGTLTNGPTWVTGRTFDVSDVTPPAPVQSPVATANDRSITLTWAQSTEPDLARYEVYRSTSTPVPTTAGTSLNDRLHPLPGAMFADNGLDNGTQYYYALVAVDWAGNTSVPVEVSAVPAAPQNALQFDGATQYVSFGAASALGATQYTLETWVYRTGVGIVSDPTNLLLTGTGGVNAAPLIARGRAESENAGADMNYFLGIDADGKLVADFEDAANGVNHPVTGTTVVSTNAWHHVAATYDGTTWRLYLDGVLDKAQVVGGFTPQSATRQQASLASALNSAGVPQGFFQGSLDEARIWSVARSGDEIRSSRNEEIISAPGLVGRWSMNQASGSLADSSGSNAVGALMATTGGVLPAFVAGYWFAVDTAAPAAPSDLTASAGDRAVTLTWPLGSERDLAGYRVYRSTTSPVGRIELASGADLRWPPFVDGNRTAGVTYIYAVEAVDSSNNASPLSPEASATPFASPAPVKALQFNGTSQYVTFGAAPTLGASQFTLETWVYRTAPGATASTGSGGVSGVPLIAKGRAQADGSNLDANYFLGIDVANKIVADFEDMATGANHPVTGVRTVPLNEWHHVAATYDGRTWNLYLDGALDNTLTLTNAYQPRDDSIQHASLGTALDSEPVAAGFFAGLLDEARIWNRARTATEIRDAYTQEIVSDPNLLGRWGMNQSAGPLDDSTANHPGTLMPVATPPTFVDGIAFPVLPDTTPPAAPQGVVATAARYAIDLTWTATPDTDGDLAGYRVYRSTSVGVGTGGRRVSGDAPLTGTSFRDLNAGIDVTSYYVVVAVDRAGNESAPSAEVSAAAFEGEGDVVFVGAGDIAICGNQWHPKTAALIAGIPGRVFTIGDNSNEQGTPLQYASCYDPSWGLFKDRTRPTSGNHDYMTAGASGYFAYFGAAAGESGKGYYSYDIGSGTNPWHVVVLNSECDQIVGGCDANSAQHSWLVQDLANAPTNNIIAMWHKPRWSSGGNNAFMQQLWQDLYEGGVELVLGGHWHVYDRLVPLDATPDKPSADAEFGVRQFVVGTGGATPAGWATVLAESEQRATGVYGVIKFTLKPDSYGWEFIPVPGQNPTFTDSGTYAVHGRPYVAPVVSGVTPSSGLAAGGTDVTIAGAGFRTGATVTFGGIAAASVAFVSDTLLTAQTPAHAAGAVTVEVRNPDGQRGSRDSAFTYTLPPRGLTVTLAGTGTGTVTATPEGLPPGFSCSGAGCSGSYDEGTAVTLTARPDTNSTFTGWTGACTGIGGCDVTLVAATSVTATFALKTYAFSAVAAGNGASRSTLACTAGNGSQSAISCASATVSHGDTILITAAPGAGVQDAVAWSQGDCTSVSSDGKTCTIAGVDGPRSVTATFSLARYTVTASVVGLGGLVLANQPGFTCEGATCTGTYDFGTPITLTAAPLEGYEFKGWSGVCTGSTCAFTVDGPKSVTATFAPLRYTLTAAVAGNGSGTVTAPDLDCSTVPCRGVYDSGTAVLITPLANTGSTFAGWSGACEGVGPCVVTMNGAKTVTATFNLIPYQLTVTLLGTGSGSVKANQAGFSCTGAVAGSTCSGPFPYGTSVTLTQLADPGSSFAGWGGDCSGKGKTCTVTVTRDVSATATFTGPPQYRVTINRTGSGSGIVTSTAGGIACGSACSASFTSGTTITLTENPDAGSTFGGWSGPCAGTSGTCRFTVKADTTVGADFDGPSYTLSVNETGTGDGKVTVSYAAGTSVCSRACSYSLPAGASATLTATATRGSFAGWTGACAGTTSATCTVTMDAARSVTATYTR